MKTPLVLCLLLIGCTTDPAPHIALEPGLESEMFDVQIEASSCQPDQTTELPVYDGSHWHLSMGRTALRCGYQSRGGDHVTDWEVHIQRDAIGVATTARLQRIDLTDGSVQDASAKLTDGISPEGHVVIGGAGSCLASVDFTCSVLIEGGGVAGDRVSGVVLYVARE